MNHVESGKFSQNQSEKFAIKTCEEHRKKWKIKVHNHDMQRRDVDIKWMLRWKVMDMRDQKQR